MAAAAVNSSAASGVAGAQARLAAACEFAERAGLSSIASVLSPSVDPELLASARRVSSGSRGGLWEKVVAGAQSPYKSQEPPPAEAESSQSPVEDAPPAPVEDEPPAPAEDEPPAPAEEEPPAPAEAPAPPEKFIPSESFFGDTIKSGDDTYEWREDGSQGRGYYCGVGADEEPHSAGAPAAWQSMTSSGGITDDDDDAQRHH